MTHLLRHLALLWVSCFAAPLWADEVYDPAVLEECLAQAATQNAKEACIGVGAQACYEATYTGRDLCVGQEAQHWENRLQFVLGRVRIEMEDLDIAVAGTTQARPSEAFETAHAAWLTYREAACNLRFAMATGGSGGPADMADCALRTTADYVLMLEKGLP